MLQEKVGIGVGGESAVVQDVGCRVAARLLTLKICSQARHGIIWTLTETASSLGSGF